MTFASLMKKGGELRIVAGVLSFLLLLPNLALASVTPKRGGSLEFAVTVEPNNYDCHSNTSFAFLHPIAPHYSTLLKFDGPNYPQIIGDLANLGRYRPTT